MGPDLVLVVLSILGSRSFRAASAPINVEIELLCCRRNSLTQVRANTHHYATHSTSPAGVVLSLCILIRVWLWAWPRILQGKGSLQGKQSFAWAQSGVNSTTTRKSEVSGAQKGNCQAWEGSELALCLRGVVVRSRLARPGPREAQAGEGLRELFPPKPARHANPGRAHRPRHLSNPHSLLLFI